jgi:small-conductance mechanosensitive channel
VVDIGWRSTRVRMLQNVVVTIPNKRVAESTITNYDMPESRMALPIRVAVDYGADPDLVQRLLLEEAAQATSEVPGLLAEPAPTARLIPGFGEFSLDFTLVCHVKSFTDQFVVQHELRRRILHRFAREGVRIPVQVRGAELRSVGGDARG